MCAHGTDKGGVQKIFSPNTNASTGKDERRVTAGCSKIKLIVWQVLLTTFAQLTKKPRRQRQKKTPYYLFQERPQKLVKCLSAVQLMAPRKPNSAKRKYVRVGWFQRWNFFFVRKEVNAHAYVTGELKPKGWKEQPAPQRSADLLIQGGRTKDLPGMKYKIIRGHKKSLGGLTYRGKARSKYGQEFLKYTRNEREMIVYKNFKYL